MHDQRKTKTQLSAELAAMRQRVAELEGRSAVAPSSIDWFHAIDSLDGIFFTLDRDQRYTSVCGQWLVQSGLPPEFFLGRTSREVMGTEAAQVHEAANARALQGESVVYEWSQWENSTIGSYRTLVSPLRDERGDIMGVVGLGRNLAAQSRIAEDHAAPAEHFRLVADFTYDWEYWLAPDHRLLYVSPSCERLSGYPPADFMADPHLLERLVHPQDRALFDAHTQDYHQQARLDQVKGEVEFRIIHRNGEVRWLGHVCGPIIDAQQGFLGWRASNRDITQRHQMESALQESEERYRLLVDLSPDAIFVHQNGRFIFANEAGLQLLGAPSLAELSTHPIWEVVHPDYRTIVTERIQQMAQLGQAVPLIEEKFIRLDGRVIDVEVVATGLSYQGQPAMQVVARDITARKQTERALRESEANLRAIFDSSQQSFVFVDTQLKFRAFNQAAQQMSQAIFGRQMQLGESMLDYTQPDNRADYEHNFQRALAGEHVQIERRMPGLAGAEWWLEFRYTPVRDDTGQIIGVFFTTTDMTERYHALAALRDSEEKTRRLFSTNLVAIAILDAHTLELLDVNEAYVKLYGWSRAELLTMRITEVSAEPMKTEAAAAHAHGGEIHIPLRYHRKKDGTIFPVEAFSGPFVWKDRQVLYVMTVDISERQKSAAELERLYDQLRADATTKAELLREVNHRVKNNLISILGLLLIEKRYAPKDNCPYLEPILESVARRVRGLLTVHQLLSDSQWAPIRLSALAERLINTELNTLPRQHAVVARVQPSLIEVSPRQASSLALIINELATNTLKYALLERDTAQIVMRFETEGQLIRLEYRDDGAGYPPEVLAGERAGVGLHLIKQLVTETLRGTLQLANEHGAVAVIGIKVEEPNRT